MTVRQCAVTRRTLARSVGHTRDGVIDVCQSADREVGRSTIRDSGTLFNSDSYDHRRSRSKVKKRSMRPRVKRFVVVTITGWTPLYCYFRLYKHHIYTYIGLSRTTCTYVCACMLWLRSANYYYLVGWARFNVPPNTWVTPILSRLAEKISVKEWLRPALPKELLLDQFAFRPTCSTTCALVAFSHNITRMLENNSYVRCLLIDFSKAFDEDNFVVKVV